MWARCRQFDTCRSIGRSTSVTILHARPRYAGCRTEQHIVVEGRNDTTMKKGANHGQTLPREALIAISSFRGAIYPNGEKTGLFFTEASHPFEVLTL